MSISLVNLHPAADLQPALATSSRRARMLLNAEGSGCSPRSAVSRNTRTTGNPVQDNAPIAAATGPGLVVEFGIGNARKVDPLLTALGSSVFAALDISLSALGEALSGLAVRHPTTAMVGICCDHTQLNELPPHPALDQRHRHFPGTPQATSRRGSWTFCAMPGSLLAGR